MSYRVEYLLKTAQVYSGRVVYERTSTNELYRKSPLFNASIEILARHGDLSYAVGIIADLCLIIQEKDEMITKAVESGEKILRGKKWR